MDFFDVVRKRRSVRRFHATAVPEQVIRKAIDAALLAPNSSNMQPWDIFWVRSPDKKSRLARLCMRQPAATTAAELIVFVARRDTWKRNRDLMLDTLQKRPDVPKNRLDYYRWLVPAAYVQGWFSCIGLLKFMALTLIGIRKPVPRGPCSVAELNTVLVKSTALACENFMLAVTAQGYGSCPMEGFDEWRVRRLLGLPLSTRVVMVISVGETDPTGIYGEQLRFDPALFVHEV